MNNRYKFNDLVEKLVRVQKSCDQQNALADQKARIGRHIPRIETSKALAACRNKHKRYYGQTSKYTPHQGHAECKRRKNRNS